MRPRLFAASLVGAALFIAGPAAAGELGQDVRAIKRDALLLVSTGLSELRMWQAAAFVSRSLVASADDSFDACIAQAAVVWQTTEASRFETPVLSEWERLRRQAEAIERDKDATPADREVCRATYRRVTAHLIDVVMRAIYCGPRGGADVYERLRPVSAAYEAATAR